MKSCANEYFCQQHRNSIKKFGIMIHKSLYAGSYIWRDGNNHELFVETSYKNQLKNQGGNIYEKHTTVLLRLLSKMIKKTCCHRVVSLLKKFIIYSILNDKEWRGKAPIKKPVHWDANRWGHDT